MQPFSTKGVIGESWLLLKKNFGVLYGAILAVFIVNIALGFAVEQQTANAAIALSVASFFLTRYILFGLMRVCLNVVTNRPVAISQIFNEHFLVFVRYIGASILYVLIVFCGVVLFIVPGIIWAIKYRFYGYLILDKNMGVLEALSMSGKITDGAKKSLFLLDIIVLLLILVSLIPFMLGLIITIPLMLTLIPLLYMRLLARFEGSTISGGENNSAPFASPVPQPPVPSVN